MQIYFKTICVSKGLKNFQQRIQQGITYSLVFEVSGNQKKSEKRIGF